MGPWRCTRNVSLFLLSLWAVAAFVRQLFPSPMAPFVSSRLEAFERQKEEVSHLFFGSSRVQRHIDPRLFDRVLARLGFRSLSFTFGVPAMTFPENEKVLQAVLDSGPSKLEYVFIELSPLHVGIAESNVPSLRNIYWHDVEGTREGLRGIHVYAEKRTRRQRLEQYWRHGQSFLFHWLNYGKVHDFRHSRSRWPVASDEDGGGMGFEPFLPGDENLQRNPRRQEFLSDPEGYGRSVAHLSRKRLQGRPTRPFEKEVFLRLRSRVEAAGARVVFVHSPSIFHRPELLGAAREGLIDPFLGFADPVIYRRLYAPSMRFDREHLNHAGAAVYTRMLARRFVAEILRPAGEAQ